MVSYFPKFNFMIAIMYGIYENDIVEQITKNNSK